MADMSAQVDPSLTKIGQGFLCPFRLPDQKVQTGQKAVSCCSGHGLH